MRPSCKGPPTELRAGPAQLGRGPLQHAAERVIPQGTNADGHCIGHRNQPLGMPGHGRRCTRGGKLSNSSSTSQPTSNALAAHTDCGQMHRLYSADPSQLGRGPLQHAAEGQNRDAGARGRGWNSRQHRTMSPRQRGPWNFWAPLHRPGSQGLALQVGSARTQKGRLQAAGRVAELKAQLGHVQLPRPCRLPRPVLSNIPAAAGQPALLLQLGHPPLQSASRTQNAGSEAAEIGESDIACWHLHHPAPKALQLPRPLTSSRRPDATFAAG